MSRCRTASTARSGTDMSDVGATVAFGPRSAIDLRSDTVTSPSQGMRAAIAAAEVGDDFYDEDPSVARLERMAADLFDKEAALLVPTGTMGNLIAHLAHCPAGGDVIGPSPAHAFNSERGGISRVAGMTVRTVPQAEGELDIDGYAATIRRSAKL